MNKKSKRSSRSHNIKPPFEMFAERARVKKFKKDMTKKKGGLA